MQIHHRFAQATHGSMRAACQEATEEVFASLTSTFATLPILAHGLADAADLPVPVPLLLALVAGAVLGLAGWLSSRAAATGGRFSPEPWSRPGPPWISKLATHPGLQGALRIAVLLAGVLVLAIAAVGVDRAARNPVPRLVLVVFWGGLPLLSLALGTVWRRVNPLRMVSAAAARLTGDAAEQAVRPLPEGIGLWPAAAALLVFVWLEQVGPDRPTAVLLLLLFYAAVHVSAALLFGRDWYGHADGFEVYSDLLGRLSPLGLGADGALAVRNPLAAVARLPVLPGLLATLAVLVGANLFELVRESLWWQQWTFTLDGAAAAVVPTAALLGCVVGCWAVFRGGVTRAFLAPALVPLVAGYAVAHYLAPLLVDGQTALAQLSDPLDRGWNLIGLTGRYASYEVLPTALFAVIQLTLFVGAHLAAVAVAHRLAMARYDVRSARAVQFPLRLVFVASAVGGVALRTLS